ncbi:hypothetical protein M0R45_025412 [Rubus argutus]|uniref:Uncharacterized protein n=1 Tax=Rubus argutus TaxID=59490 RepID=A0AAW1WWE9_RUBAR
MFHLSCLIRTILQCRNKNDPVEVISDALSKSLVYYYPLAGRLRDGPKKKLMVDCTGEGVLLVEANADVLLDKLRDTILTPCPLLEEFLYNSGMLL